MGQTASPTGTLAARRNGNMRRRNANRFAIQQRQYPGKNASREKSANPTETPARSRKKKWSDPPVTLSRVYDSAHQPPETRLFCLIDTMGASALRVSKRPSHRACATFAGCTRAPARRPVEQLYRELEVTVHEY